MADSGYEFDGAAWPCNYQAVNLISFTTDFGTRDWFVGTMKAVVLGINPRATLVDLTHEIPPGDIRAGAFALAASCRYFPTGTVHVAVVDPGVGSARRAIAVRTAKYTFVGPDNGVLTLTLAREQVKSIRSITNEELFLQPVSRTFHGRDIFAPVAAHLSRGMAMPKVGPTVTDIVKLNWPEPSLRKGVLRGEVIYVDRFGNAITNLDASSLHPKTEVQRSADLQSGTTSVFKLQAAGRPVSVLAGKGRHRFPLADHYQAVPPGKPVAVFGSSGRLELAINGGSAAKSLRLKVGLAVQIPQPSRFSL